jgi:hypothetical protein
MPQIEMKAELSFFGSFFSKKEHLDAAVQQNTGQS